MLKEYIHYYIGQTVTIEQSGSVNYLPGSMYKLNADLLGRILADTVTVKLHLKPLCQHDYIITATLDDFHEKLKQGIDVFGLIDKGFAVSAK